VLEVNNIVIGTMNVLNITIMSATLAEASFNKKDCSVPLGAHPALLPNIWEKSSALEYGQRNFGLAIILFSWGTRIYMRAAFGS
jgi:hypothetical protein